MYIMRKNGRSDSLASSASIAFDHAEKSVAPWAMCLAPMIVKSKSSSCKYPSSLFIWIVELARPPSLDASGGFPLNVRATWSLSSCCSPVPEHQELAANKKPLTHQGGGFPLAVENFCFSDLSLHIEPETLVPDSRHLTSPSQVARPPLGSHS
jgi:hypothetical protein